MNGPASSTLKNRVIAIAVKLMLRCFAALPLARARAVGRWLGGRYYALNSRDRRVAKRNIQLAYPHLSDQAQSRLVLESLQETGALVAEMGHLWVRPWSYTETLFVAVEGQHAVEAALAQGRGVIVLGPHLGNWEALGLHLATLGDMVALFEPPKIVTLGQLIQDSRQRSGGTLVPTTSRGIATLVRSVKNGGISGILPDQVPDSPAGGLNVPFMGVECATTSLGCNLIRKSGALAFMGAAFRIEGGFRVCYVPAPNAIYEGSEREALTAMNTAVADLLSGWDAQYQWQYKRFRMRPDGPINHYRNLKHRP